jgi:hypothetical protein
MGCENITGFDASDDCKRLFGCVLSTEEETDTVKIMFLRRDGPSPSYTYSTRQGVLQVPRKDILMVVELCTATCRTFRLRAEKNDEVNKKHASFHKQIRVVLTTELHVFFLTQ